MGDELGWPRSAERRASTALGHLVISVAGALAASIVMVEAPTAPIPFLLFLLATWVTVSELANAADTISDFGWAADDGAPRPGPWSDGHALRIGRHLREAVDRIERPTVHEPIAVGGRGDLEVVEILDGGDGA